MKRALIFGASGGIGGAIAENLSKQHLFSLTDGFLKYLNKKKIHVIDLTNIIQKIYKSPELYFLCTKQKKYINKFKELK